MNKNKFILLLSIFCLFIAISPVLAMDNDAVMSYENSTVTQADYYVDANSENDNGNGTIYNPYKEFDLNNISDNSVVHIANGEYILNGSKTYSNLSVIGQDPEKTIVSYYSTGFYSRGLITFKNITLLNLRISLNQNSNLTAVNTIFAENSGSTSAISSNGGNTVILDNCSFNNNSAQYGGAINLAKNSTLNIKDSIFANNHATYWGGAIACDDVEVTIYDTKFLNNYAADAGGAVYLKNSQLIADNLEMVNNSALFGGAISSLSCDLKINNSLAKNNRAKYYGGAIFKIYTSFVLEDSIFENNSALNGGALYVADVEDFKINSNRFENNIAYSTGGAVYSIFSDSYYDIDDKKLNNNFKNNHAEVDSDVYQSSQIYVVQDENYILMHYNPSYTGNLPSKYDLRNLGYVTPVRSQGSGGNCWSFSASAALESAILKATGITYDLSEENMKNIASMYSAYGWAMETNTGGYDKMAIGYLTSWLGPANESDDAYSPNSLLSSLLNTSVHIQNIVFLTRDNYTDNDAIKKAIMDYGAVSTSIYWSSSNLKNGTNYYNSENTGANHAVAIVGWDDNYAASKFNNAPPGNGAWIIKNSWGTSGGDKGFYYVSYYDTKLAQPGKCVSYAFVLNDTIKYDKNYQYDIPGRTDNFLNESATVWYKNSFTATDEEYLTAVSTYFEKDTDWDLYVYVNNALKLTQSGFANPSYKTIDLNSLIPLKAGDIFEIVFKITVDKEAGVPISESISLNSEFYRENISFISYDGKNWQDFYELNWTYPDHTYNSQVACIKAFTVLNKIDTSIQLEVTDSYNPVEITAKVLTQYGTLVKSGKVTFNVEGKNVDVNVVNGIAKLSYVYKSLDKNTVKATFSGVGFNGAASSIAVNPKGVTLIASDLTTYFGEFTYSAKLVDENNKAVSNKELKFTQNNKNYIAVTDKNGLATIKLNLSVGIHKISIGFNDLSDNSYLNLDKTITVKTTIDLSADTRFTFNAKYSSRLLDSNGNAVKNTKVNVLVNGEQQVLTTDSNGNIVYTVDLNPGTYQITITNPLTGEVKSQTIDVVARITGNKAITMYYGAGSYYKVRVYDDNGNIAEGVKVKFTIGGKSYTRTTDSSGYASFKIGLQAGTYAITATYNGYNVSNKVVVKPTLVLSAKTVKKSKTFAYKVKLLNNKGKILKYKKVTVKFRGKTYKVKTTSKGIATFKIKALSKTGKFTLTASYGSAKVSKIITVKK